MDEVETGSGARKAQQQRKRQQAPRGKGGVPVSWRIRPGPLEQVREISRRTGIPQPEIVERAIDRLLPPGWEDDVDAIVRIVITPSRRSKGDT